MLFYCTWKSGFPLRVKTAACLPGFSQFMPISLVLLDPPFLFSTPSAPSYRSLICHLLGYYMKGGCTCSSLKGLLADTLQPALETHPRHAGTSFNLFCLTQTPFCSYSTRCSLANQHFPSYQQTSALFKVPQYSLCCSLLRKPIGNLEAGLTSSIS